MYADKTLLLTLSSKTIVKLESILAGDCINELVRGISYR